MDLTTALLLSLVCDGCVCMCEWWMLISPLYLLTIEILAYATGVIKSTISSNCDVKYRYTTPPYSTYHKSRQQFVEGQRKSPFIYIEDLYSSNVWCATKWIGISQSPLTDVWSDAPTIRNWTYTRCYPTLNRWVQEVVCLFLCCFFFICQAIRT